MISVTIKDIAEHAGVSIATVSYVINESRPVSPELTERVLNAVEELGYSPNEIARSLRLKQTNTIGLLIPDNSNPFFSEIAKGVEDAGFESGYNVILCNSNWKIEREIAYLELLRSRRVDGVIYHTTATDIDQIIPLVERGIPVVVLFREVQDLRVDSIRIDNHHAGYIATRHLIELGHRQIACVKPASDERPSGLRVEGFKDALKESGVDWQESLIVSGDNRIEGGMTAAGLLLESGGEFTALFAGNDAMAIGAMRAFREKGILVPGDISIVGVDDIQLASFTEPPLTTVAQPKYDAGRLAVELLLKRLDSGTDRGPEELILDLELIQRKSCAPLSDQILIPANDDLMPTK